MIPCVICGAPSDEKSITDTDSFIYDCFRCGKYLITEEVLLSQDLKNLTNQQKVLISGWIRENQGSNIIIDNKRLKSLNTLPELSLFEKADKMLLYLAKKFPVAGMKLNYKFGEGFGILEKIRLNKIPTEKNIEFLQNANDLLPLVAIGRIIDEREFSHILGYLTNEQNYISKYDTITSKGWAYLETFRHPNPDSKKAFVAMWFTDEMEEIYDDHIRKAIEDSGYKSIQIGRKEHNNDINDEIIGEIRSCKFVVADLTGNRGGVYYEAGFANGLNLEVIHTCRKDYLKDVHFDINHRNIIVWESGEELYEKLLNRIKATIV